MRKVFHIAACLFAVLLAGGCRQAGLTMNYSAADISAYAEPGTVLAGFAARNGLSDGMHEPIASHCLVLSDGTRKVCVISNDLMEISPFLSDSVRTEIAARSGLDKENVLMACIHTHSTPRLGGRSAQPGGSNHAFKKACLTTIVDNAVATIGGTFKPFTLETGKARTAINYNRCEPGGPVDRDVYVARFLQKGKPVVSIVNLACHPVCMGPKSYLLSSDYPGVTARFLREAWGGDVFQLTGAAGNMDPDGGPKMVDYAESCGKALADSLRGIRFTRAPKKGLLRLVNNTVDLPYQIETVTPEAVRHHADSLAGTGSKVSASFAEDVRGWEAEILARFEEGEVPSKLRYHLHGLDVDGILFFFSDGEPFCEYQMEARAAFPDRTVFFSGYTNGQNSYLPSEHAYAVRKGYEYEIEQMHVYIKAPYPLSDKMPATYRQGVLETLKETIEQE